MGIKLVNNMKKILHLTVLIGSSGKIYGTVPADSLKRRTIVLTGITPIDGVPDDTGSMIRLFVSADHFEIDELVATTGGERTHLKSPDRPKKAIKWLLPGGNWLGGNEV